MNVELNTFFRSKMNAAALTYNSEPLEIVFPFDNHSGTGAYAETSLFTAQPTQEEIGFQAAQQVEGYYQVMFNLPDSDLGLHYNLNTLADALTPAFPRQSYQENFGKIEIHSIERLNPLRIGGKASMTCRIHYRFIG